MCLKTASAAKQFFAFSGLWQLDNSSYLVWDWELPLQLGLPVPELLNKIPVGSCSYTMGTPCTPGSTGTFCCRWDPLAALIGTPALAALVRTPLAVLVGTP